MDQYFSIIFKNIYVVYNSLIGLCISVLQINYDLTHAECSLLIRVFNEH